MIEDWWLYLLCTVCDKHLTNLRLKKFSLICNISWNKYRLFIIRFTDGHVEKLMATLRFSCNVYRNFLCQKYTKIQIFECVWTTGHLTKLIPNSREATSTLRTLVYIIKSPNYSDIFHQFIHTYCCYVEVVCNWCEIASWQAWKKLNSNGSVAKCIFLLIVIKSSISFS